MSRILSSNSGNELLTFLIIGKLQKTDVNRQALNLAPYFRSCCCSQTQIEPPSPSNEPSVFKVLSSENPFDLCSNLRQHPLSFVEETSLA